MAVAITVSDLAGVVYSSGKVFDGLTTGRLDTESFLRSGSTAGITWRSVLALLEDLRDVAQFIIDAADRPIDAGFVQAVNAQLTRSGSLQPGRLRSDPEIGVDTRYGRHLPAVLTQAGLQRLLDVSLAGEDPCEMALDVFIAIAKAQPFGDGNKRPALFVANALLLKSHTAVRLVVPVEDEDPSVADRFNDLLARAYVLDEPDGVKELLRQRGLSPL